MNPLSLKEAEKLLIQVAKLVPNSRKTEIVACPPFLYLENLKKISRKMSLGAQDAFWGEVGAYTGQVSAEMLYNLGVKYVILGHSEMRTQGENDFNVNKKIKSSLASGLYPVLCVGESIRDENHKYLNFVKMQIEGCLHGISKDSISKVIVAYEPIWAIGKGAKPATAEEFLEMGIFIRKILSDKFGLKEASNVRIIYGGSLDEKNAGEFIKNGKTDGFLVGRASLNPKKFSEIIKICEVYSR